MKNIEPKVFTTAYDTAVLEFPTLDMDSVPSFANAKELACRLYEFDSSTEVDTIDLSGNIENTVSVSYELQVRAKTKEQATKVYNNIHNTMINIGFRQLSRNSFFEDTNYRIVARYRGRLDENGNIF